MVTVRSWSLARPLGRLGEVMGCGAIGQGGAGKFTIAPFTDTGSLQ
jgi:hypothetical protein